MNIAYRSAAWRTGIQILLWRHGWAWPLSIALLLAAAGVHVLVFTPSRVALAAALAELAREQNDLLGRPAVAMVSSEQQRLDALQALLQQSADPGELVRRMAALAQSERIELAQGDYHQEFHSATQAVQVHITQPVRASYPQLRRYIEAVLRSTPNASLDQIAARRENVSQTQLEARLRWSIWMQPRAPLALPAKPNSREAAP